MAQTKFTTDRCPIDQMLLEPAADILQRIGDIPIDCVLVSTNDATRYLAAILSELCHITPKTSSTIESMCSSGGAALISACSYVMAGLAKTVLVAGAENLKSPGALLNWDITRGQFQSPIYWGSILTKAYMRRYGVTREDLASIPAKNISHAKDNPHALHGSTCTIPDVLGSRYITEDLNLLDCSQLCAGSAAILIADHATASGITDIPVQVAGFSQYVESAGFGAGDTYHAIPSARMAAEEAYKMADIQPHDIDIVEVHDAFSVCEPMALEAMRIAPAGQGAALCAHLYQTGSRMVNPRGGILGSGHPLGATGLAQVAETFSQLRGEAGKRQVDNAHIGSIQGMAAAGTSSVVMVMKS